MHQRMRLIHAQTVYTKTKLILVMLATLTNQALNATEDYLVICPPPEEAELYKTWNKKSSDSFTYTNKHCCFQIAAKWKE